ncbi:helix-turn-helix transcriptional regulator [Paenibacillus sp. GYB004]|jgi:transcriptional regulator with XRE-family HTH domain|uniref:helix-turn-helix transcriptional regulator n=1 Tax=Paenibacillus sp. GYB004 TaxID=2994393 RepID=UPI003FA764EA
MALHIGRSRLPELLVAKKWTQADFARRLGISQGFLSQVISGKRHFSYPIAANAAWLLDCPMEELHEIKVI